MIDAVFVRMSPDFESAEPEPDSHEDGHHDNTPF